MKILVLYHTAWIEAMYKSWQRSGEVEVASLPLPVVDWDSNPGLKDKIARLIVDYAMVWRPDLILDVNGAGVMPVAGQSRWTPELAMTPWVEWWFDDPFCYVDARRAAGTLDPWLSAIGCPLVKNCVWDATIAKEYSEWTGKRWRHLPTATDPELYSPDAAENSPDKFKPVDFCFLGSFYQDPNSKDTPLSREINVLVSRRIMAPRLTYFDNFAREPELFKESGAAFAVAKRHRWGAFDEGVCAIKHEANAKTGCFQRSEPLKKAVRLLPSNFLAGDGMPASFNAFQGKVYTPSKLSACYSAAALCLDLANGQSHSGTNMRAYEIMASGGILVCNRRPDFDPDGELDGHVYFGFGNAEELPALCERVKSDAKLRRAVSSEARAFVRKSHSWLNRLPAILQASTD